MRIVDLRKHDTPIFSELNQGDVFCYCNKWYMKIKPIDTMYTTFNAIRLCDGVPDAFCDDCFVEYHEVELNIIK